MIAYIENLCHEIVSNIWQKRKLICLAYFLDMLVDPRQFTPLFGQVGHPSQGHPLLPNLCAEFLPPLWPGATDDFYTNHVTGTPGCRIGEDSRPQVRITETQFHQLKLIWYKCVGSFVRCQFCFTSLSDFVLSLCIFRLRLALPLPSSNSLLTS